VKNTSHFLKYDGINFYSQITTSLLFNQVENNKDKKIMYSQALKEYFNINKNKQGNPVLAEIQFKTNL
jgi:hypothetical protein